MVEILKVERSVSSAEEFLHFSSRYRDEVAQLLSIAPQTVDRLAEAAASAIDDDEVSWPDPRRGERCVIRLP